MYARACRAWYGRRAPRIIKETIKRLHAANDETGVRIWTLVAEQLASARNERSLSNRLRIFE
jgi:ribosomal protein L18E